MHNYVAENESCWKACRMLNVAFSESYMSSLLFSPHLKITIAAKTKDKNINKLSNKQEFFSHSDKRSIRNLGRHSRRSNLTTQPGSQPLAILLLIDQKMEAAGRGHPESCFSKMESRETGQWPHLKQRRICFR